MNDDDDDVDNDWDNDEVDDEHDSVDEDDGVLLSVGKPPSGSRPLGARMQTPRNFSPRGTDETLAHRGSLSTNFSVKSADED